MKFPVVIVGAGLSGIRVASLLSAEGVDCLLLESRDRVGGRALTTHIRDNHELGNYDLGPTWFWPEHQTHVAQLVSELGLATFCQHTSGAVLVERFRYEPAQRYALSEAAATTSMRLSAGIAGLASAAAATLPEGVVRQNARVLSIADNGALEIVVERQQGTKATETIWADIVVLALPPRVIARRIRFQPVLPPALFANLLTTPTWMAGQAKAIAVYERPFWREAGLSGLASSVVGPLQEIHDASPASGAGALFGFFGMSAKMRKGLGEGAVRELVISQFVRLFGPQAEKPCGFLYKDWAEDPNTAVDDDLETVNAYPMYGPPSGSANLWNGRVIFAGTETASEHGGYLEGALRSAENATAIVVATWQKMNATGNTRVSST